MTLAIWSSWAHIDIIRKLKTTTIEIITTSNVTIMYCHFHHNNYQEHFFFIFIEGKPQSLHSWLRHHHEAVFFILTHSREATAEPYESHADAHHFLIAPIFFLTDQFWHLFLYFDLTFNWLNRSSSILLPYFMKKKFSSVTPISVIQFLSTGTLICWLLAKIFKIQDS